MDYLIEGFIVSVDTIIFAYCLNSYLRSKNSLLRLETVPQLDVDANLGKIVAENEGVLPYACLRGNVKALSPPIHSFYAPTVTGVIHKVTVREHVVAQNRAGFWTDSKRIINEVFNSIPFAVQSTKGDVAVEVVDALSAKSLDLEVVADRFDPVTSGFLSTLWQLATGVRKQGVQTMEELLKEGTLITVVGEVVGGPATLSVVPPSDGAPFFITTMPLRALLRRVESDIKTFKWLTIFFGAVTAATFAWISYKRFRKEADRAKAEGTRRNRRKRARVHQNLSDDKLCVVCQTNPKEVILLPCGHVCLCEDCSDQIPEKCPICNQIIQSRNEAYIA